MRKKEESGGCHGDERERERERFQSGLGHYAACCGEMDCAALRLIAVWAETEQISNIDEMGLAPKWWLMVAGGWWMVSTVTNKKRGCGARRFFTAKSCVEKSQSG